jgi:hypothetical protein
VPEKGDWGLARNFIEGPQAVDGLLAASRIFPELRSTIQALLVWDEDFRQLCSDLADAQAALARWENSPSPARDARVVEYREIVAHLSAEVRNRCTSSERN